MSRKEQRTQVRGSFSNWVKGVTRTNKKTRITHEYVCESHDLQGRDNQDCVNLQSELSDIYFIKLNPTKCKVVKMRHSEMKPRYDYIHAGNKQYKSM